MSDKQANITSATTSNQHHSPPMDITEIEKAEIQNMAAIRSLLFGKQSAQINSKIKDLEGRFEDVAKGQTQRINILERESENQNEQNSSKINDLQGKVEKLEEQLLQSTKLLRHEISMADGRGQILLFEKVKDISDATLKDFEKLRADVRSEIEILKQNARKNSEVGEVLLNLGRQLQVDPTHERSNLDDSSKRE